MTAKPTLILLVASLVACAHAKGGSVAKAEEQSGLAWYPLPGGEYSVLMPPQVTHEEKTAETAQGPVRIHIAEAVPPGTGESFLVSFAELPEEVLQKTSPSALLDGLQGGTLRQVGGTLISSRDVQEQGMTGREFEAQKPGQGKVRARVLLGDKGVYTLVGTYWGDKVPEDVTRFLSSLSRRPNVANSAGGQPQPASGQDGQAR